MANQTSLSNYKSLIIHQSKCVGVQQSREMFKKAVCGYSWMAYEKRLLASSSLSNLECLLHLTQNYIETQCHSKYGFLTQVSSNPDMQKSTPAIPNIYDSAIVVEFLNSAEISLTPSVQSSIRQLLLQNQNKDTGLWNYFHLDNVVLPEDIDSCSSIVSALLTCGLDNDVVHTMAENILQNAVFHKDGLVDIYFEKHFTGQKENLTAQILNTWPVVRRIDLGATANFLYLQHRIGHTAEKLVPCFNLLNQALEEILSDDINGPMVSRLVSSNMICANTLTAVVQKRLLIDHQNPVSIACRVLAGINCGLHNTNSGRDKLITEVQNLIGLQNEDFSFSPIALYNAHKEYHFGSTALSSALALACISKAKAVIPELEVYLQLPDFV